jgi:hypothetical protein
MEYNDMRRSLWTTTALLCIGIAGYGISLLRQADAILAQHSAVDPKQMDLEDKLLLKGLSLVQGEKGIEFWRVKASWASMKQSDASIDMQEPNVWYTVGEEKSDDLVYAVSRYGRITDNQRVLTMWDDVVLTRMQQTITAPRMVYYADKRTLHFPEGANIDTKTESGKCSILSWSMGDNIVSGEHGVEVKFYGR